MKFERINEEIVSDNWKVVKIADIGKVIGGGTPSTKKTDYFGGEIPWITPKDLSGYDSKRIKKGARNITLEGLKNSSAKLLPKNTVLLSSRAPIGYVAIADNELSTNQGFKSVICDEKKVVPDYLYYVLSISKERLESVASGSTFKEVSGNTVKNFEIPLPPLAEQKSIVSVLSKLDDKIELNNSIISNLEEIAQTLFKRWFVDFEFPNEKGQPYKSSGGKMVESELGMIPEGWNVKYLSDLGEFKNGINYNRNPNGDSLYRIVNVRNIVGSHFLLKDNLEQLSIDHKNAKNYLIKKGDTLIVRSASPGEACFINEITDDILYSGFTIRFRPNELEHSSFIFFHLYNLKRQLDSFSTGTTLKNLNQKILKSVKVTLSNNYVTSRFDVLTERIFSAIQSYQEQNVILSQVRDTLLPKLLSGEIELPDTLEVTEDVPVS